MQEPNVAHDIHNYRAWYAVQGIIFILCGVLAGMAPWIAAFSAAAVIGALLLVTGIFQLAASLMSRMHFWSTISALLSIGIGGWMLWQPVAGVLATVLAITFFLTLEGVLEIMLGMEFRPSRNWAWLVASGIASLVLAVLLWTGFPVFSAYYLGLIIAINFILYGVSLVMLAANAEPQVQGR
jgi:uncharacterized membrane protein HdeD (DUF308 family)